MPRININGVGWVTLDDTFDQLTLDQQNQTIDEIARSNNQADPLSPEMQLPPLKAGGPATQDYGPYDYNESFGGTVERAGGPTAGESLTNPNAASGAYEAARGVVNELGTMLGLPIEAVTGFGRMTGLSDMAPGEGMAFFKRYLNDHGFPQGSVDSLMGKFGEDLTWNLILTGATTAVGKRMMKPYIDKATGKLIPEDQVAPGFTDKYLGTQNFRYNTGRAFGSNPVEQQVAAAGGSFTQAATEHYQGESPATAMVGYLPGAGLAAYGGRRLAGIWEYATRKPVTEAIAAPTSDNPIGVLKADLYAPKVAADEQVARDIEALDKIVADATEGPTVGVRPRDARGRAIDNPTAQDRFEKERDWAEDTFRQVERTYWDKATSGNPVETDPIKTKVDALHTDMSSTSFEDHIPQRFFDSIEDWEPSVPTEKIWDTISALYAERKRIYKLNSDFAGDKARYAGNLDRLEGVLREALERAVDDPRALAKARAITSARKQRFTDGPMGEARYMEGRGHSVSRNPLTGRQEVIDFRREPAAPLIAETVGGPKQVQATQKLFDRYGITTTISDDFENAVRTDYLEQIYKTQPDGSQVPDLAAADKWMNKHQASLAPYKRLLTEFEDHIAMLRKDLDDRKALNKSAIAQVAHATEGTMQTKVNNAFFHPKAQERVLQLNRAFTFDAKGKPLPKDHDYVAAWEALVVNTILKRGGNTAKGVQAYINDPATKKLLQIAFARNPDRLERLYKAVDLGVNLEADGVKGELTGLIRNQAVFWSGIFGAKFGTALNSGSIQVPGYFARSARNIISRTMNKWLPQPPGEKLWWAIHTPEGYNWLTKNVYEGVPGLRKSVRQGRRMIGAINTQTHERLRQWMDENGVRPREEKKK